MAEYRFQLKPDKNNFDDLDSFLNKFKADIVRIGVAKQTNQVFALSMELLTQYHNTCKAFLERGGSPPIHILNNVYDRACKQLHEFSTSHKRQKELAKMPTYVQPEEKSIGYRWDLVKNKSTGKVTRQMVQSTFQYVSIFKQLESVFSNPELFRVYMDHNRNKHACAEDIFEDACCGSMFATNPIFSTNQNAIQIQLFTDEFDPCDPLKSISGVHKVIAFYFQIRNLPRQYLSKLDSIYLVALCNSNDLKNEYMSVNNILEVIVNDIKILENVGITIGDVNLKGGLLNMCFDNLGANICLGLSGSFSANYYCRFCETKKELCQKMTSENSVSLRTRTKYEEIIANIKDMPALSLNESCGIKSYCALNDLRSFHMLENWSVDIMHDVLEGCAQFLLNNITAFCIDNKIVSARNLEDKILFFNYGAQHKKDIPRKINVEKRSIHLSAAQTYCLMLYIPYILDEYREKLSKIWETFETMQQIVTIIFSTQIKESDIIRLTDLIEAHLTSVMEIFKIKLLPKHHFLVHYPSVIRKMGPIIFTWAMRMEAKHCVFKNIARKTKNFIDINYTLAHKHQEMLAFNDFIHVEGITFGKIKENFINLDDFEKYCDVLGALQVDVNQFMVINSATHDGIKYKSGFLIHVNSVFYPIDYILTTGDQFWLLCDISYAIERYDKYYNSLILKKNSDDVKVFNLMNLSNKNCYETFVFNREIHVIVTNLDLYHMKPINE